MKINDRKSWNRWCQSGQKPDNIPTCPWACYEEWTNLADFLGNSKNPVVKDALTYEEAKIFVQSLRLSGQREWNHYVKSRKKPKNIPSQPQIFYKDKGWISWGDFLGTGNIYGSYIKYRSYKKAKTFARKLKFKGRRQWTQFAKSEKFPKDIPATPDRCYKNSGWEGWGEFLGTGNLYRKQFLTFKKARTFVRKLKLKSTKEWLTYCKTGKRPHNIPSNPHIVYQKEWKDMADWLGYSGVLKKALPFKQAKAFVRKLKLKNNKEWLAYCKSGKKPQNIPKAPQRYYAEWEGLGDWLGTGTIAHKDKTFLPFKDAKKFARKLKLTGKMEWMAYCKSDKKPKNIPTGVYNIYRNKGWKGWKDFLGTK